MNNADIAVVVICLIAGYGLVSAYYKGKEEPEKRESAPHGREKNRPETDSREQKKGEEGPQNEQNRANESASGYSNVRQRAKTSEWYLVLLIQPSASAEEIRAAYRRRIAEYHPDKVVKLGVELRALAEEKSKEINVAFKQAMAMRGR